MPPSRRTAVQAIKPTDTTHAGLWFDKYLREQSDRDTSPTSGSKTAAAKLVEEVAKPQPSETYGRFFQRWQAGLSAAGATTKEAAAMGRMAIGLGGENPIETAITLHRTYGVPYIPGSALKGLAASFARNRLGPAWQPGQEAYKILFGSTEGAGYLTFFDALYIPRSGKHGQALYPDVITVHHPDYYQGSQPPADWDNPTPIDFLSATGRYLLGIAGDDEWVTSAYEILNLALQLEGIGAKTSSGYGRMQIQGMPSPRLDTQLSDGADQNVSGVGAAAANPEQQAVDRFVTEINQLPVARIPGEIHPFYQRWKASELPQDYRHQMAGAIIETVARVSGKTQKRIKSKAWYQEVEEAMRKEANGDTAQ